MPREYRISLGNRLYLAAFSVVWFGVWLGAIVAVPHDTEPAHLGATLALLALALAPGLVTAWIPYKARLDADGAIELRSVLRRRRLRAAQIREIEWDEEYIYLRYDGRKVSVLADENFRDLLARVLELKPLIKIDGAARKLIETPT